MKAYTIREEDVEKWKWPTDPKEFAALGRRVFGKEIFVVNEEDFRWGTCTKNSFTKPLDELARNTAVIESIKGRTPVSQLCLTESMFEDPGVFSRAILENDSYALRRFADAIDQWKCGFQDLTTEKQVMFHLLCASRILYLERKGAPFTKPELQAKARLLWARARCRARGIDNDSEIKNELNSVLSIEPNWDRVFKKIGLTGVKNGKRGRKPNPKL